MKQIKEKLSGKMEDIQDVLIEDFSNYAAKTDDPHTELFETLNDRSYRKEASLDFYVGFYQGLKTAYELIGNAKNGE